MRPSFTITALLCAGLITGAAFGGTPNPKDAERIKADSDRNQKQSEALKTAADQATGDVKTATLTAADAYHALADLQAKISTGVGAGDDVHLLQAQYPPLNDAANRANDLVNTRKTQAGHLSKLTDAEQVLLMKGTPDPNKPLATDLINARRKVVEASEKLAVLLATPGSAADDIDNAREVNQQAIDAYDLAQTTLQINNDNVSFLNRPGATDPSIATGFTEMTKIQQDYLAAFKNARDQASVARQLQRKANACKNELIKNLPKAAPTPPTPPAATPAKK